LVRSKIKIIIIIIIIIIITATRAALLSGRHLAGEASLLQIAGGCSPQAKGCRDGEALLVHFFFLLLTVILFPLRSLAIIIRGHGGNPAVGQSVRASLPRLPIQQQLGFSGAVRVLRRLPWARERPKETRRA
jgi:hypothetical protein